MLDKDIKNLEEIINLINEELDKKDKNVSAILDLEDLLSLRNLIKAYKELEEENSTLKKAHNISENVTIQDITNVMNKSLEDFNKEYIPVSLVEETIEELDKEYREILCKEGMSADKFDKLNKLEIKTEVLQELLEKRK